VREYIRIDGRKDDEYLGTVGNVGQQQLKQMQADIELAKGLVSGSSKLRLFGYQRVERKTAAVLAVLFNHELFQAGLTIVGSHAYGSLLNEMGIVAAGYATQDIDVARAQPLSIGLPEGLDFHALLNESGLEFAAVPGMPSRKPSASFKLPGARALAVDLLVPGNQLGKVLPAEDLRAHAQAIPLLDFLIDEPLDAAILGPNHVVPVKVPAPERFVLHKLYSSQSRRSDRDKVRKDLGQAAVVGAALAEDMPEALEELSRTMPTAGRAAAKRGARAAAALLGSGHAAGREAFERIAGR
jgi:hypothetical protein